MIEFYFSSVFVATLLMGVAVWFRPGAIQEGRDVKIFLVLCLLPPIGAALGTLVIFDEASSRFED